jgi:membrane associated rhomboid family serine protease
VWLFARPSSHIGASGLTHGLMFFVFVAGVLRRDKASAALAMIVFFMYGGMVMSIMPRDADVSFEFHLFGALAGVILAFLFRNSDPKPPRKHYDWEDEDEFELAATETQASEPANI